MCGRFTLTADPSDLQEAVNWVDFGNADISPRYNIAPSQGIPVVTNDGKKKLDFFTWGLVPHWAKDPKIGFRMINARSETVATKPSFRNAFKKHRCLIPSNGFYEWKGTKGQKQPMFLTLPDGGPFAFAGLWEIWDNRGKEQTPYRSCTILTREASESVKPIHHRMPVILKPEAYDIWLDPDNQNIDSISAVIQRQIYTELTSIPVSKQVNSVKNNGPENIQAIE